MARPVPLEVPSAFLSPRNVADARCAAVLVLEGSQPRPNVPPYSPDLDQIEKAFAKLKSSFAKSRRMDVMKFPK